MKIADGKLLLFHDLEKLSARRLRQNTKHNPPTTKNTRMSHGNRIAANALKNASTSSMSDRIGLPSPPVVAVLMPRTVAFVACAPNAALPARIVATMTAPRGI